jgi:hypothetical protein
MKRKLMVLMLAMAVTVVTFAQGGGGGRQRRTVAERVQMIHNKFDSTFHFEAAKQTKVDSVFAGFYREQDKMREEMMANAGGGPPDDATREAMRTKMQEMNADRDEKLQQILTADEYTKWKKELEPSLRPQRGPGGPGGGGNGGGGNGGGNGRN